MDWINQRKKIRNTEITVIMVSLIIILFGFMCEYLVSKGCVFLVVPNLNDVSLVLLQIQATIMTLTLTVIALLSGNISDSHMGISISAFFLDIRPCILKQKYIIFIEFIGLILSVFGYLFRLFNVIISIFVISILIILVAIFEVYSIFRGRRYALHEIQIYINYIISEDNDYLEIAENLIFDWKSNVNEQSAEEFDSYLNVFFRLIDSILLNNDITEEINVLTENVALFFLKNESDNCKVKGMKFVQKFYDHIWLWIFNNQDYAKIIDSPVVLISSVDREWYSALSILGTEKLEREDISFNHFSESIIRVASWIGFSIDAESYEVSSINSIARAIGRFLNEQNRKGIHVNAMYWKKIIADKYGHPASSIPDDAKRFYKKSMALRDFNLIYGFLLNGQMEYVKEGFFLDGISKVYKVEDEIFAFKTMLIHCFMYYLAYRESDDCIDVNFRDQIKNILTDKDIVKSIKNFYYRLSENVSIISEQTKSEMIVTLQPYELFPKHSDAKIMIISEVIKEYFLYISLLIVRYSFNKSILNELLNTQDYYSFLVDTKYNMLRNSFFDFHRIFDDKELSKDDALKKSDEMLFDFTRVMKEKYKHHVIEEASLYQKEYDSKNIHDEVISKLQEMIETRFYSLYGKFDINCGEITTYKKVHVYSVLDYTSSIAEDLKYYDVFPGFTDWIIRNISSRASFKHIIRGEYFQTDEEFRSFIESNHYEFLIGSQYAFGATNYMEYKKHNDFLSGLNCIFINGANEGLALRERTLFLRLNNIEVDISSPRIEDVEVEVDESNGLYCYSPEQGISLEFDEDEIRNYLYNERKRIDIYFNVTVGFEVKKENGVFITRKIE